jgi:hypothetical protein
MAAPRASARQAGSSPLGNEIRNKLSVHEQAQLRRSEADRSLYLAKD